MEVECLNLRITDRTEGDAAERQDSAAAQAQVLNLDQQHLLPLGTCQKCKFLDFLRVGLAFYILTSPTGYSDVIRAED